MDKKDVRCNPCRIVVIETFTDELHCKKTNDQNNVRCFVQFVRHEGNQGASIFGCNSEIMFQKYMVHPHC
jgi:hypothetical protein